MPEFTEFSASDVPDEVIKQSSDVLKRYSTALVRLSINWGIEQLGAGSGTFITLGEIAGILTAHHVVEKFSQSDHLGLTLMEEEHNLNIPFDDLVKIPIGTWKNRDFGPDMEFLQLPPNAVSTIKNYKDFYPLAKTTSTEFDEAQRRDLWFVYGLLNERTRQEDSKAGFREVMAYTGFAGMSYPENTFTVDTYDYIEVKANYGEAMPKTFEGMSGGGLWRVPLLVSEQGVISPKDYYLEGVTFLQSEVIDNSRLLRCHGRKSLSVAAEKILDAQDFSDAA